MATHRYAIVVLVVLGLAAPAYAQLDPTESMGSGSYQDEHAKAAKAYRQGLKFRQRAEKATEAAEREELYRKALEKFHESAGYVENFDARLALGEVYLALGNTEEALMACTRAKALKPRNDRAKKCFTDAGGKAE